LTSTGTTAGALIQRVLSRDRARFFWPVFWSLAGDKMIEFRLSPKLCTMNAVMLRIANDLIGAKGAPNVDLMPDNYLLEDKNG
jgi:hypothetical protein